MNFLRAFLLFDRARTSNYLRRSPKAEYVYAVAIVKVPTLPEPKSSKGEGLATIVAGKVREENVWGYLHFEKDTKQTIAAFMLDEAKCEIGKWYFIRVGIGDPEVSDEAQIPEGTK